MVAGLSLAVGCARPSVDDRGSEDTAGAVRAGVDEAPLVEADGSAPVAASPPAAAVPLPEPSAVTALIGPSGGALVAGTLVVEFPANAIAQPTTVAAAVLPGPDALPYARPASAVLGAYRVEPTSLPLERAAVVRVTLPADVPEGTRLELLVWQPRMRAFLVGDDAIARAGGVAVFGTRVVGEMLVRAAPVATPSAACAAPALRMRGAWPGGTEEEVVGLTEIDDRIDRPTAFNVLTDFRLLPELALVDFKNEEVVDVGATPEDDRDHQDEDFLMDPAAAAAVARLARLVEQEWQDPISGRPAVTLRVTEAYDSLAEHQQRSSHYQGRAVDLTLSPVPAAVADVRRAYFGRLSSLAVCAGFDYVLFENEFHVHASVRETEFAVAIASAEGVRTLRVGLASLARARQDAGGWGLGAGEVVGLSWSPDGVALVGARAVAEAAPVHVLDHGRGRPETLAPDGAAARAAVAADGLRRLLVIGGRVYLANSGPTPQLGSVGASGTPIDIVYPYPVALGGETALAAGFRARPPAEAAVASAAR